MVDAGVIELRPGAGRLVTELARRRRGPGRGHHRQPALGRAAPAPHPAGEVDWDVIVAGDDVTNRKPDPEVFTTAVEKLGIGGPDGPGGPDGWW